MLLENASLELLKKTLPELDNGFEELPALARPAMPSARQFEVMEEVAARMQDNFPYFHPLYAGQMLKPPHPIARAAYALATWINPNNHAMDGGRASSVMEKEAVAEIAQMFGWKEHLGHLCGGGTMANLEALWVAGQLRPGKKIVASDQAHYTHERITSVLKLPFASVPSDSRGRVDTAALAKMLGAGDVGCIVATIGTTGTGSIDPLPAILELAEKYGARVHADCAYGGYFKLATNLSAEARAAYDQISRADSIVIDPHKHGLQPYGCGCVLFRDPSVGALYKHESPYTYFTAADLHLGEISLECSRPGAAAVALWATQRLLPLAQGGEFAKMLESSRQAAIAFSDLIAGDSRWAVPFAPELDIVVWAPRADTVEKTSELSQRIFDQAAKQNLHLALIHLPARFFANANPRPAWADSNGKVLCLRSVLMKPEHRDWLPRIWEILSTAADAVLNR
ncbi:MAG: aminotransferase class I/II-fold pyridoxal phosphate-dependent enzyme [Candidatus Acidiferrales bacterium]|jgi:glutamate/tyrosine decarboxylase-like PLP-dependent enzyme